MIYIYLKPIDRNPLKIAKKCQPVVGMSAHHWLALFKHAKYQLTHLLYKQ